VAAQELIHWRPGKEEAAMNLHVRFCVVAAFCAVLPAQDQPATDALIWEEYVKWVRALPPLPVGQHANPGEVYIKSLTDRGISPSEAQRRLDRVTILRRGSPDREKFYWDHTFKLGGGPSDPLRVLLESIQKTPPGRALDPGMGRGRNGIWLASLGWDVTGYDISADALAVAQEYAKTAGVRLRTIVSSHDNFDFGENQWDLIVCAYNFMDITDPRWPRVFWRALKPKGLVVWQIFLPPGPDQAGITANKILEPWARFHLIRFDDLDPGVVDDDWAPSRSLRTIRLVVRKGP
jgi:SAM-dependent methyltransferase